MAKSRDPLESLANRIQKDITKQINQSRFKSAETVALSSLPVDELAEYTGKVHRMLTEGTKILDRKLNGNSGLKTCKKVNTERNIWDFLILLHQGTLVPKRIFGAGAFGAVFEGQAVYNTYNCREFYAQEEAHEFLKTGDIREKVQELTGEDPEEITGEHRDIVFEAVHDEKLHEAQRMPDKEIVELMQTRYKKIAPKGKVCIKLSYLPESHKRLYKREKQIAGLDHKNIAYVFAVDTVKRSGKKPDDTQMLVMTAQELVSPIQTGEEFEKTGLDQRIDYAIQIGEGLRELHRIGMMHRDFKSANVLITKEGTAKIIDTGMLKKLDGKQSSRTGLGESLGSPAYFAPEQAIGGEVDERADIYAVGATLYEFLTGRTPNTLTTEIVDDIISALFDRSTLPIMPSQIRPVNDIIHRYTEEKCLSEKDSQKLIQDLDLVMAKMLHRDPEKRYQEVKEYITDMRALLKGENPPVVYSELEKRKITPKNLITESFSYHLGNKLQNQEIYQDAAKSQKLQRKHDKTTFAHKYLINPALRVLKPIGAAAAIAGTAAVAGGTTLAIAHPELAKQIVDYIMSK
jgi:serine/threonine protein kinase